MLFRSIYFCFLNNCSIQSSATVQQIPELLQYTSDKSSSLLHNLELFSIPCLLTIHSSIFVNKLKPADSFHFVLLFNFFNQHWLKLSFTLLSRFLPKSNKFRLWGHDSIFGFNSTTAEFFRALRLLKPRFSWRLFYNNPDVSFPPNLLSWPQSQNLMISK